MTGWLSAHLWHDAKIYSPEQDRLVVGQVAPFVAQCVARNWITRWFFVRYTQGGPHLRVRVHGDDATLDRCVRPALQDYVGAGDQAIRAVDFVPYVPEPERYGGARGVALAERIFDTQSDIAVVLLRRHAERAQSARLGIALLAMITLWHVFERPRPAEAIRWYGETYLSLLTEGERVACATAFEAAFDKQVGPAGTLVRETWDGLEDGCVLPEPFDRYRAVLDETRLGLLELGLETPRIAASYLHMMNNRLGVSLIEEAYLAHVMARALDGRPV